MAEITMDTDWGARGSQLTGGQVQTFIKSQLISLQEQDTTLQTSISNLTSAHNNLSNRVDTQTNVAMSGVYIVYNTSTVKSLKCCNYYDWVQMRQYPGVTPHGVAITSDSETPLVIALEEATHLPWQNQESLEWELAETEREGSSFPLTYYTTPGRAYKNTDGAANCEAIMECNEHFFAEENISMPGNYAPGWCSLYSHSGIGNWHLPSFWEMCLIWRNLDAINACLGRIEEATQITSNQLYWTSTKKSHQKAYTIQPYSGSLTETDVTSIYPVTRPVLRLY